VELELRHLRRLVAIADTGEFAGAARALGVSEAALVAQLDRVEAQLGERLFVRGAPLRPTARGRDVLDAARLVLVEMGELVAESRRGRAPTVRLAGPDAVLTPVAARFAALRPGVPLTTRPADAHDAAELVRDGAADACATLRWPVPAWPLDGAADVQVRDVDQQPLRVLVADTHRLAGREVVDLTELTAEAWCVRAGPAIEGAVVAECVRHGFEPDVRYRLGSDDAVADMVATGGAVALVAEPPRDRAGTVVRHYRDAARSTLVLAWRTTAVPADVARNLVAAIEGWNAARAWAPPADPGRRSLGSAARPLRIGSIDERAAIPAVPQLRTLHGLHSAVVIGSQAELLAALGRGELDLVLCQRLAGEDDLPAGTDRRVIAGDEPVLVAVGAGHPLAGEHVALEALADETWAVRARSGEAEALRALGAAGGFEPRIATTFAHSRQVAAAVASGRLVRLADGVEPEQGIVRAVVRHPAARRTVLLLWPAGGEAGDLADVVAEELRRARVPYVTPYPEEWL
jgi:DNA-binding transcriptional LysR family regulator